MMSAVWHFYTSPVHIGAIGRAFPDGSVSLPRTGCRAIILGMTTPRVRPIIGSLGVTALGLCNLASHAAGQTALPAPRDNVVDTYHGVQVVDPYRWLEKPDDPRVKTWTTSQNQDTRQYLDGLPQRAPIFKRLFDQISATSSSYSGLYAVGDRIFALYTEPPKQQPMIAELRNAATKAGSRIIVDPNAIDPTGTTAIDWFVPSPDGKLVAVSLSRNGSEDGTLHVFDVASSKELGERIARVQYPTGGGSVAWRADGKGFWYTRYPGPDRPASERHFFQQVYFHLVGADPASDSYVLGREFPRLADILMSSRFNPKWVVVSVANGDGGEFSHYLIAADGTTRQITRFSDKIVAAVAGPDDALYLVSRKDAPRGKILKLGAGESDLARAAVLVPESDAVIQGGGEFGGEPLVVTANALYVRELVGGPSRVSIFDHAGRPMGALPLPDIASVAEIEPLSDGTLLYSVETYLKPPYFSRYDPAAARTSDTQLVETSPVSFADAEVVREFATSKDGTSVPLNIIRRRDAKLDGSAPVLLTGYGGYNVSLTPTFLGANTRLWLDGGGIYVIANLRGGGEFGERWHEQGALTHKQNVFDDFIGAARYLIDHRYTSPQHLAIIGGSNGGLLMGAVMTQYPELFHTVVARVGIYDMLRAERDPNGSFNVTEFGSVKDDDQFKALYAYSPYHHVVDGTAYPSMLMLTGATDGRVNPAHSRKMTARLQAATSSGRPILLGIDSHTGHGIGSALSIRVNQSADIYAFLFDQLRMRLAP
jgi:prolyl oligopeptidase